MGHLKSRQWPGGNWTTYVFTTCDIHQRYPNELPRKSVVLLKSEPGLPLSGKESTSDEADEVSSVPNESC